MNRIRLTGKKGKQKISSPLKGEVIALSDVQDEAFSSGALGLGAAVDPKEGVCMHRQTEQSLCFFRQVMQSG